MNKIYLATIHDDKLNYATANGFPVKWTEPEWGSAPAWCSFDDGIFEPVGFVGNPLDVPLIPAIDNDGIFALMAVFVLQDEFELVQARPLTAVKFSNLIGQWNELLRDAV